MTVEDRASEWLASQNRHRSYPLVRSEWRRVASPESGLDCVVLDALLFDQLSSGEELFLDSIKVERDVTTVSMSYGTSNFTVELTEGQNDSSFETVRFVVPMNGRDVSASMSFSCHRYILETVGEGFWKIGCRFLRSRVASMTGGLGVKKIATNGSAGVEGHETAADVTGEIVLEDGFRTSPVIWNGSVLVRVGRRYGQNPCKHDYGDSGGRDCKAPLLYFCGQNAINSGNIVLKGGVGVSVEQGREYLVRDEGSRLRGRSIPCVEVIAGRELLGMAGGS